MMESRKKRNIQRKKRRAAKISIFLSLFVLLAIVGAKITANIYAKAVQPVVSTNCNVISKDEIDKQIEQIKKINSNPKPKLKPEDGTAKDNDTKDDANTNTGTKASTTANTSTNTESKSQDKPKPQATAKTTAAAQNKTQTAESADLGKSIYSAKGEKTVYLTFDDGPSKSVTPQVLDILKKYNIKATFFVVGSFADRNPDVLKRIVKEGHVIGNHTYTHDYKYIYANVNNFMGEIKKSDSTIENIVGKECVSKVIRFPGGSFGKKFDPYKTKLSSEGYKYVDWNALNGDAEGHNISSEKLIQKAKDTTKGKDHVVLLMHDAGTKGTTVKALPKILDYLIAQGYKFKTL
jgi:peptidoglycan/xylan/chitin deacetylase (PgdA/CDA1 family)